MYDQIGKLKALDNLSMCKCNFNYEIESMSIKLKFFYDKKKLLCLHCGYRWI